ncbi:uncharacterized protein CDAR_304861 [Caerostris darwini]|uniref:Uncharacterized protein n=1 Tax=Caerostris darwini TaxID=1538125 RepID=A0AAV4Q7M9_9ARAC|nr:uncharacterized protein CDAR_304861 [Caerostris darwini]
MNYSKYGNIYSKFHGCTDFTIKDNIIILDFYDQKWDNWMTTRIHEYDKVSVDVKDPFSQAFKVFFKTEATCSAFCKQDSFTLIIGNVRVVFPMPTKSATNHLYATPYFVQDPQIVHNYLQGIGRHAYDHIFNYKNCVLYLDKSDVPCPGGCYFGRNCEPTNPYYRICVLSQEPYEAIQSILQEWKHRRGILEIPFLTQDTISPPKFMPFEPISNFILPDLPTLSMGMITKKLSLNRPHCLIHDILNSYYRHCVHQQEETGINPDLSVQSLGLVLEWPLRVMYEGLHYMSVADKDKQHVAIAVNGRHPNKILHSRVPYTRYSEYESLPALPWLPISYVPTVLDTPEDVSKVSIDTVVIGLVYHSAFFCLSLPLLEGRPCPVSHRNVHNLFTPATQTLIQDKRYFQIIETFRYNNEYLLHHVSMKGIQFDAWCLCKFDDTIAYPKPVRCPSLVQEWLSLFAIQEKLGAIEEPVDVDIVRMALVLAKHNICFNTKIMTFENGKSKKNKLIVSDAALNLYMGKMSADFINDARLEVKEETNEEGYGCNIM